MFLLIFLSNDVIICLIFEILEEVFIMTITKEDVLCIILMILNIGIAYMITIPLGIQNQILFQSYSATAYCITYEVIIWFVLSLIGAGIIEKVGQCY